MPTTVIMKTSRPDGAGGTYKQGSTYTLADDLAAYFLSIGAAKRTSTRSEQTGATISGNAAGQFPSAPALSSQVPVTASTTSSGGIPKIMAGDVDITDQIGGGGGDGAAGPAVLRSYRNIPHDSATAILLPTAPQSLAISWYESGTSGNLRYVLEAASLADATSRLSDDTAHGEIASGGAPFGLSFEPTNSPVYLYVRASSAVGAGSSILTVAAKVPA